MSRRRETAFVRCALASGLLTSDQVEEARTVLPHPRGDHPESHVSISDQQLADKLVELGWLNLWQSKQLLEGRTKFSLGPYWIVDSIGRGGMGQVFKAKHDVLDRIVAIKVLPRNKSTPEAIANFSREIRAQAKLDHKNLVRALDAGEDGNVYYLVTEYVPGTDLRRLVRRNGRMDMTTAAGVISQVAAGLQHAHDEGVIHRDVKPGNVLVTPEGHAKLSDLGLASPLGGDAEADPQFGKIVGTADYLSPDHIMAPWNPTPAWDIYSLGCTLYYAVTGKVPFPKGTTRDKALAHCELRPLDPRRLNTSLDSQFVEVLADMMAKERSERIHSSAEVIDRLAPWTEGRKRGWKLAISSVFAARSASQQPPGDDPSAEDEEKALLEDTQSSFPEIPDPTPGTKEGSSQAFEATDRVGSATDETASGLQISDSQPDEPLAVLGPLMFLVGLPVALVGLITLVWWLLELMR